MVARLIDGEVPLVIDVGANRGQYATELRRHGYRGQIVSFEPVEEAFEQLASAAAGDTGWTCHRMALGAVAEEAPIHVASNLASSSLLEMELSHRSAAPSISVVGVETVRVARLDDVVDDNRPCLLKLDVQGYEDRVLDGAPRTLGGALLFQCELCTGQLYSGQAPVRDVIDRLADVGFVLIDLDPVFWDAADGRVLAVDALFARRTD